MEVLSRIGGLVVVGAVLMGIEDAYGNIHFPHDRQDTHTRSVAEGKDEQNIHRMTGKEGCRLLCFLFCVYQFGCRHVPNGRKTFPEFPVHIEALRLQPGKLVPVIEMADGKESNNRFGYSG